MRVLIGVFAAWAAAWSVVVLHDPGLALVAGLGFLQNLAFTFVSRGRNSGSLGYHMVASIFSNGIWVTMFVIGIKITTNPEGEILPFAFVYCLSTMAGSVFAHWLARKVERGKARNVQEDRVAALEERLAAVELNHGTVHLEGITERVRLLEEGGCAHAGAGRWAESSDLDELEGRLKALEERLPLTEQSQLNDGGLLRGNVHDVNVRVNGVDALLEELTGRVKVLEKKVAVGADVDETRRNLEALAREVWGYHADQGLSKDVAEIKRKLEDLDRLRHALRTRATIRDALRHHEDCGTHEEF